MDAKFDGIVLSGAGVKGMGELGTLHYYFEKGNITLSSIKAYCATSIGSVIALLMVCGYTPMDIFSHAYVLKDIIKLSFTTFNQGGLVSIKPLMDIVAALVIKKINKIPSLLELYELTGKHLVISVGNVSKLRGEYFTHLTKPTVSVIKAIEISCSLPYIFERISCYDDQYTDGGLTDNFPCDHPALAVCKNVLGVIVMPSGQRNNINTNSFFSLDYLYNILNMSNYSLVNQKLKTVDHKTTIVKLQFDVSILEFSTSSKLKMEMFTTGFEDAKCEDTKMYLHVDGWSDVKIHTDIGDGWCDDF